MALKRGHSMIKHCKGCGVQLQNEDPNALGYVPSLDASYCQRCFKLTHYGEVTINMQQGIESNETFEKINAIDCVVFWVVDLFCFEASMISRINQKLEGKDIVLVLTKRDLLPKTLSDEKILDFVEERLEQLQIDVVDVVICSDLYVEPHRKNFQLTDNGIFSLRQIDRAIEKHRKGKDVMFMGMANVGKSTLLNHYLQDSTRTISRNPGTTLDLIPTPMEDYTLYDSPGIENDHSILTHLNPKDLKTVIPMKRIRPYVSQIYENQSFAAAGLARLDIVTDGQASVVGYFSRSVAIHRGKMDDADRLWNQHLNGMLSPCIDTSLLTMHTFHAPTLEEDEKMDVVIHGLGWFCVSGSVKDMYVRVHKGIHVSFRKAMI